MQKHFLLIGLAFLFSISALFAQTNKNLVVNSDFKNGTKGWKVLAQSDDLPIKPSTIEHSNTHSAYGINDEFEGKSFVELDGKSALQQEVSTKIGETYSLLFSCAARPDAGDKKLFARVNDKIIHIETYKNSPYEGKFFIEHAEFKATSDKTIISFYVESLGGSDDMGVLLTDILFNESDAIDLKLHYSY